MTPERAPFPSTSRVAARDRNQARLRIVTATAGLASLLAAAGLSYGLPGSAQASSATEAAAAGTSRHGGSAASGSSSGRSGAAASASGLKSAAAPAASSGSAHVTSGGS